MESNIITQVNLINPETFKQDLIEAVLEKLTLISKTEDRPKAKPTEYLTRQETAKLLKVTTTTLYKWDKRDILKPIRMGNEVRYRLQDIEDSFYGSNN